MNKQNNIFEKNEKFDWNSSDNLTAYDIKSIMHYDGGFLRGFFSNPIMTEKITGNSIGINKELSLLDIQKLNKIYPCKQTSLNCGKFYETLVIGCF